MALITLNKNPSPTELRWFGVMFAAFFGLFGMVAWFFWGRPEIARWMWLVAGALVAIYYLVRPFQRPMYLGWLFAAYPIGWTVSHLLMGIVYFLLITPIGLIMRAVGRDPMQRRFDPDASSYWRDHVPAKGKRSYFRQF
jgi:hypothetical protein